MVNEYMSAEEMNAKYNPYAQPVVPGGHMDNASPSQWELRNQMVSPASGQDRTSAGIESGRYAETQAQQQQYLAVQAWKQQVVEQQQADAARRAAESSMNEYGGYGTKEYGPARERDNLLSDPFSHRADVYPVTDTAQLGLMKTGLTSYQAAEKLRYEAQQRGDYAGMRYYETLGMQAWTTETGKSAEYHYQAKESGLPQAPNPYEYTADLLTYAMKGYPTQSKDRFSPVDYMTLGLPEGKGGQAYIWANKPETGITQPYDLRGAMDRVAYAQRTGEMGPYGNLGKPYSSAYGTLSLEDQQAIGRYVNENPVHQAKGFVTKDTMGMFTDSVRTMDRGTFVPIAGKYESPTDLKKPFQSVLPTTTNRPSDATLSAMSMWGGENSNPIARGMVTLYDFLTPSTKIVTTKGTPALVDRKNIEQISGGAMFTRKFIGENGKTTDVMDFKIGNPYLKDGNTYQDYERVDLSKVVVTPESTKTLAGQSGFSRGQDTMSDMAYNWLGDRFGVTGKQARQALGISALVQEEMTNRAPTPMNIATNMGISNIKETFDKPAEAGMWFGVGIIGGAAFRGAEAAYGVGRGAIAERVISQGGNWRRAIQGGDFVMRNAPRALAGIYAIDVAGRATAWGTELGAGSVSSKGSKILIHEAIPMAGGSLAGYYAPEIAMFGYRSAVRAPSEISDAVFAARQRMAGIRRMEPGTTEYQYNVRGIPVYNAPRTPSFDNAAGTWSWGGVKTRPGSQQNIPVVDLTPTLDLTPVLNAQTGKVSYYRPSNVATPGEQRMIMTQFRLTPGEVALAKRQGLSLNDILSLRETETRTLNVQQHSYNLVSRVETMQLAEQKPELTNVALFGNKELVGNNLLQGLRRKPEVLTVSVPASAYELARIPKTRTITAQENRSKSLVASRAISDRLTLPKSDTRLTTIDERKSVMENPFRTTDLISLQRARTTEINDPFRTGGRSGGGSKLIPPILPIPFFGGGGGSGWGGKGKRGRMLTQLFTVDFGDVTAPMFSSGLAYGISKRSAKKKKRR